MGEIFQVDHNELPWIDYEASAGADGRPQIRIKALTADAPTVPPVQYVEYGPDYVDPIHRHKRDEFFIVVEGELWLDDVVSRAGGVVFIPNGTEYAVRAGAEGVRYFRVVV